MSIATEKLLHASERFMLVRITPAYCLNDDLSLSSGLYVATLDFENINKVERNGSALTEVSSTPTVNDTYQYNSSTGEFKVKLASAPSASNIVVLFFDLFYTGAKARRLPKTPSSAESGSNPVVKWAPKISKYPKVKQTIKNVTAGVLTIGNTSISIIDADDDIKGRLGENYSWHNKDVKIWLCINDVANIQRIYTGKTRDINVNNSVATISIYDTFAAFSQSAYMGDKPTEAVFQRSSDSYPDLYPNHHGRPNPFVFGTISQRNYGENLGTSTNPRRVLQPPALTAVCTDYSETISTTTNRDWAVCRVSSSGVADQSFGTFVRGHAGTFSHLYLTGHTLSLGETVKYTVGGLTEYGTVVHVGDFVASDANTYNVVIADRGNTNAPPITGIGDYDPLPKIAVQVDNGQGQLYWYRAVDHYTSTLSTNTSSGNVQIEFTFNDNFESFWSGDPDAPNPLDPATHTVYVTIGPESEDTHADALKAMIEAGGLTTNAASFTATDSALSANARFSIPYWSESSYGTYLKYIEAMLRSTLGYISLNASDEIEYHLFDAPSSADVVDNRLYLDRSISISADYNDVATSIIAENRHVERFLGLDLIETAAYQQASSDKAKYLHGVERTYSLDHLLERIDGRIDDIMDYISVRRGVYKFKTATRQIDAELGDDLQIEDTDITITGVAKDGGTVEITGEDLKGL